MTRGKEWKEGAVARRKRAVLFGLEEAEGKGTKGQKGRKGKAPSAPRQTCIKTASPSRLLIGLGCLLQNGP